MNAIDWVGQRELAGGTIEAANGAAVAIGAEPRVVGADPACDLVITGEGVAAAHVELVVTSRGVRVRDLGSTAGTRVDGLYVDCAYLDAAATIACGAAALRFVPSGRARGCAAHADAHAAPLGSLVGSTPAMVAIFERLQRVAPTMLTVLVTGETGTGKELVARAVHGASARASGPFVAVSCAAIPEPLLEAELFGHERGAFTGADRARPGLFVEADGGTLFLDEVGETTPAMQAKLLRALETREVRPVGSARARPVDVRVVAATRRDLVREVNAERFRSDLYFRLAQARVELPPLRQRLEDVPALVERIFAAEGRRGAFARVTPASFARLARHAWPGNVRELRNVIAVALAYDDGGPIDLAEHVAPLEASEATASPREPAVAPSPAPSPASSPASPSPPSSTPFADARRTMERAYFAALHAAARGNVSEIARQAGLDRKTARAYLRRHGLVDERIAPTTRPRR